MAWSYGKIKGVHLPHHGFLVMTVRKCHLPTKRRREQVSEVLGRIRLHAQMQTFEEVIAASDAMVRVDLRLLDGLENRDLEKL